MRVVTRVVAVSLMLSLAGAGPLASLAAAQQPAAPPPVAPAPAQPSAPPTMFQEEIKPVAPASRGIDVYDVGAVAATAFGLPFKAAICAMGGVFAIATFAGTFGTRPDATAAIINEGCGGKAPWIVRGHHLRPRGYYARGFDWETHRFEWEK